jgi:hypothetical protein
VEYFPAAHSTQILAPGAVLYLPAVQAVHVVPTLHAAVKPEEVPDSSDDKVTWRKPVGDVYNSLLSVLNREPDSHLISLLSEHETEKHLKILTTSEDSVWSSEKEM